MGLVVIEFDVGLDIVYVLICFLLGKNGCEGCVCLYGMFGGGNLDMGLCLVVMICFGFDNGVWGCEYVDLWLNCMVNDVQFDLYQVCVLCIGYGGCVLVGDVKNDDGNLWLWVGGDIVVEGMSYLRVVLIDGGVGNFLMLFFIDGGKICWLMFKCDGVVFGGNGGNDFGVNVFVDDGVMQFFVFCVSCGM